MKKAKVERFENAIMALVENVVPGGLSVFVGEKEDIWSYSPKQQVVIFTADDFGLTAKEKNKVTKKLVKAFIEIAEQEVTVISFTKNEVILEDESLEKMFPKSGRLTDEEKKDIDVAIGMLEDAVDGLYDAQHSNTKVEKIRWKISELIDKLGSLQY